MVLYLLTTFIMEASLENIPDTTQTFAQFTQQRHREADRNMRFFVLGYFVLGLLLSFYYDTWLYSLGVGGSSVVAYFITTQWMPGSLLSRMTIGVVMSVYMFQFIAQMHGMYEMHFFFFINIAILLIYQDWRIFVPYTALVVLHHGVLFMLQKAGADVRNYTVNIDVMTYTIMVFHLGLAAFMAVVCGWWAIILQKRTLQDFKNKQAVDQQLEHMNRNIAFATEITQGNLEISYELREDDRLGYSLSTMRESLLQASQKDRQEKFESTGLAEVGTILREHTSDLHQLSQQVVSYIVRYLDINQGGLFILMEDEEEPYLSLTACYAYDRQKMIERRIALGEGLAGQAVLEKDTIYMTEVPDQYVRITSGLGHATPRSILIVPLKSDQKVVGVIEFAAFRPFEPFEITFLEKLAESIAASVMTAQINQQTTQLLEQARWNEEELRAQEEEMRQNMEELQATQEEVDRKVKEYEDLIAQKNEEIERLQNSRA